MTHRQAPICPRCRRERMFPHCHARRGTELDPHRSKCGWWVCDLCGTVLEEATSRIVHSRPEHKEAS